MARSTLSVLFFGALGFCQAPYSVTCQSGLPYGNDGNPSHTYNVCYPTGHANDPSLPAIVYWHGGAFRSGNITSVSCPAGTNAIWCWYAAHGYASYLPNYTLVQDLSDGSPSNILTAQSSGQISLSGYALTSSNVGNRLVVTLNKQNVLPGGYTIESLTGTGAVLNSPATTQNSASTSSFNLYDATTEYPAPVTDGFCFLDWFGNNSGQNNVPGNPNGLLTWGHSAGGYIVEMLYLMPRAILGSTGCDPGGPIGNWTIKGVTAMSAPADLITQYEGIDGGNNTSVKELLPGFLGCVPGYQDCNMIGAQASPDSYKNPAAMGNFLLISGALDTTSPPANQGRIDPVNWVILKNETHVLDFSPSCPFYPKCGTAGQAFAAMNAFFQSLQ